MNFKHKSRNECPSNKNTAINFMDSHLQNVISTFDRCQIQIPTTTITHSNTERKKAQFQSWHLRVLQSVIRWNSGRVCVFVCGTERSHFLSLRYVWERIHIEGVFVSSVKHTSTRAFFSEKRGFYKIASDRKHSILWNGNCDSRTLTQI